jgi:MarR family transcriptional regulator for hemolysin
MIHDASPRSRFGIRFSLLARRWRQALDAYLAAAGLTDATWIPLVHLHETGGGITQKHLATLVGIEGSSLVRLLDILSREGLIERRMDDADGRARLVHLTPDGTRRVMEIRNALASLEHYLLDDLADAEIAGTLKQFDLIEQRLVALKDKPVRDQDQ